MYTIILQNITALLKRNRDSTKSNDWNKHHCIKVFY